MRQYIEFLSKYDYKKLFLAMGISKMLPRINITIASVSFSMYDSVDFKNKTRLHILDGSSPEDTLLDKIYWNGFSSYMF